VDRSGVSLFLELQSFLGTPLLYYEVDVLQFSKVFVGALGAISNAAGLLGAVLFFAYCRKIRLDRLLSLAVALGVASTLSFVGLIGPKSAVVLFWSSHSLADHPPCRA